MPPHSSQSGPPPGRNDKSGLPEGDWQGGYFLGQGGQGAVHYWVKADANQKIIDRVVIKDEWSWDSLEEPEIYKGIYGGLVRKGMDMSDALGGESIEVPFYKEAYIQGLLTPESLAIQSNTVRLRGYRRGDAPEPHPVKGYWKCVHWRLYMEHLYAGDLHQLISWHAARKKLIPEPFIWWTMKCLASALKQMEDLSRARVNAREEQDETIVLLDMKPGNIFLDGAGGPEFKVYPRPVIGDLGSAHLTYADQTANRSKRLPIYCTPGFTAPEFDMKHACPRPRVEKPEDGDDEEEADDDAMDVDMDDEDFEYEETVNASLDSWSNVWQLGKTIEAMMRLETRPNDRDYEDPDARESDIKSHPPRFAAAPEFCYSVELLELVRSCQEFDPECRPAPEDILYAIDMDSPPHIHGIDTWGSEDWVAEQYKNLGILTDDRKREIKANIFKRARAGKLWFLHDFEDRYLAEQYQDLDLDLPRQCELAWAPQRFRNRIGQRLGAEEPELAEEPDNKRPRTDEAITVTQTKKKRRIA
ncbi:unnamed protein product [Aureobasidium uvarum]|uniref:non-specific serine/threonine protein kinase n=1 Tax=Aureobasidium uvarum TaxID=2773716 RepID=A0A9N8PN94_9PEZI|nr:unnamed protein product [Aureobasidium uvarum]